MPTSLGSESRGLLALRLSIAVALLLAPTTVSADSGPFPLCDASGEFFCIGDIDFTSVVVATDPPHPTSDEPVALRIQARESAAGSPCHGDHRWSRRPTIAGHKIVFEVQPSVADCPPPPPDPRPKLLVERSWDLGLLPAGVYTVQLRWNGFVTWAESRFEVHSPTPLLHLHGDDFVIYANRALPGGGSAPAAAVPLTDQSGYFTFYDPGNVELTIKILDGRAINGHYWVFIASMTDRPFELTVLHNKSECFSIPHDPYLECPWRTYTAPLGVNRNFIDVNFPATPPP